MELFGTTGPQRRAWLDNTLNRYLDYYLGPTGIPDRLRGANEVFNPVVGVEQSGQAFERARRADNPMDAALATGQGLLEVAGVVAPAAGVAYRGGAATADDAARALTDVYAGVSGPASDFALDEFGGIRAWHGSPHDFDKFSLEKIGTGEGAQAYGHGLYFAENAETARAYRDALRFPRVDNITTPAQEVMDDLNYHRGNVDAVKSSYRSMLSSGNPDAVAKAEAKMAVIDDVVNGNPGRLYEVEINANPEDFLDWDAPLSEQPEGVRRVAETTLAGKRDVNWQFNGYNGGYFQKVPGGGSKKLGDVTDIGRGRLRVKIGKDEIGTVSSEAEARALLDAEIERRSLKTAFDPKGADVYAEIVGGVDSLVHDSPNRVGGTDVMREAGIPGIRYLDQGSRGAGDGTRNYVVFDDNLISIIKKYGIAGAAAMLGMTAGELEAQAAENTDAPVYEQGEAQENKNHLRSYLESVGF